MPTNIPLNIYLLQSTSDLDDVAALHMGDHYKMPSEGLADQEEMLLIEGMVRGLEW
jgi:hypothetical protein